MRQFSIVEFDVDKVRLNVCWFELDGLKLAVTTRCRGQLRRSLVSAVSSRSDSEWSLSPPASFPASAGGYAAPRERRMEVDLIKTTLQQTPSNQLPLGQRGPPKAATW